WHRDSRRRATRRIRPAGPCAAVPRRSKLTDVYSNRVPVDLPQSVTLDSHQRRRTRSKSRYKNLDALTVRRVYLSARLTGFGADRTRQALMVRVESSDNRRGAFTPAAVSPFLHSLRGRQDWERSRESKPSVHPARRRC